MACQVGGTLLGSEFARDMILRPELRMGEEAFGRCCARSHCAENVLCRYSRAVVELWRRRSGPWVDDLESVLMRMVWTGADGRRRVMCISAYRMVRDSASVELGTSPYCTRNRAIPARTTACVTVLNST